MQISVSVKFENRKTKLEKISENKYFVFVKAEPVQGKANKEILKIVAKHFKKSEEDIKIISGAKGRKKIIKIVD
jgi:hypothetical protein